MSATLIEDLKQACSAREPILASWEGHPDGPTDAWRVFHGATEGRPGLTVDRYGPVALVQTFRQPLSSEEFGSIEAFLRENLEDLSHVVWNHRGKGRDPTPEPSPMALRQYIAREHGLSFLFQARHRGRDPWLFLDFRSGRRTLRERSAGRTVLNLFSYTCGAGVAAAAGGATEVWNVDFAQSALRVGKDNWSLNGGARRVSRGESKPVPPTTDFRTVQADVIPTVRQLAGQTITGRAARRRFTKFDQREFGVVVLDPPTFAKGPFGAVDLVRDYAGLFKPALLATQEGGAVLATNHVSTVDMDTWLDQLRRCATKAGRPLEDIEVIAPDGDFPSPDGKHPLKMAWCSV